MGIKIIKSSDPILTDNLIIVLYGSPGVGKTSLGFSTNNPLLLDFDLGAQRSLQSIRKDCVQIKQWSDISDLTKEDLKPFDTIVVDTAGRLLEIMETEIKNTNPKMINRLNGGLSLQGFGQLNTMFKNFMIKLKSYGKDIILIMHDKEDKNGDAIFIRPDAIGSSKTEINKIADLMGYVSMNGKERNLDFNPTESHLGKNCAEIPEQKIPNLANQKSFLADLIEFTKAKMNAKSEEMVKAEQEFQLILDSINELITLEEFNAKLVDLKDAVPLHKQSLVKIAADKGYIFNKDTKQFNAIVTDIPANI